MAPSDATVRLGVVGPAHGLRGEVLLHADADLADAVVPGLVCTRPEGDDLEIVGVREHKQRMIVAFAGIDHREAAEALRGTALEVDRADVDSEDAVWVDVLLGSDVVDDHGDVVGIVERVDDGPAHDWLIVARPDGGELSVPLVAELLDVDTDAGQVTVRRLPGLLDDDWA